MADSSLPSNVKVLGWISFWADVSSELAYPILPLFIVGTLKAPSWTLGFMEGLAGLVIALLRLWSGFRSDREGRRAPYIRWGYGLSSVTKPLMGSATSWPMVVGCRLADRVGKGIRTSARDALIADSVEPTMAGRAFGFHRMMDTAGAFLGVCIGAVLVWKMPDQLRTILFITAIPGLVAVGITFLVKEPPASPKTKENSTKVSFSLPSSVWKTLAVLGIFGLANSSDTFLLLFASHRGYSALGVVCLYALFNLTYALCSRPFGSLADRLGSGKTLLIGWALFALCYLMLPALSGWHISLLFAAYGIATAATDGVSKAYLVQKGVGIPKGSLIGTHYFILGLVTLVGNLLTGFLWAKISPEVALFTSGGVAVLSAFALAIQVFSAKRTA